MVSGGGQSLGTETKVGDVVLWSHDFGESDRETMSAWADDRKQLNDSVVVLALGIVGKKPTAMLAASAIAMKDNSIHAGNLLKALLAEFGGRGGGKPNFAQGGVPAGVGSQDVIEKLAELLK